MRNLVLALGLALAIPASAQQQPLAWLVGQWCTEPAKGETVCETWQPMGDDQIMRGISETRRGDVRRIETMHIINDAGRLVFHAEPPGQAPTDFFSTTRDHAPASLAFENRAHDYPQRVRYWREGELLLAEISLADGGKPMRWTYRRVAR